MTQLLYSPGSLDPVTSSFPGRTSQVLHLIKNYKKEEGDFYFIFWSPEDEFRTLHLLSLQFAS
jgi:hypothetical protein